ncbi:MAG: CRISPR-associated endonuclease Cas1 [Lachnospiraceae bacterium]|nr:CRISPR-associated endonuclease Cas1 [Lachnospiraceae bacterium]
MVETIEYMTEEIRILNKCNSVDQMLLEEARCRQQYNQMFRYFITKEGYEFVRRTKRPPMDKINALISFGNTLLYNRIQQFVWKTSLDSRIGVVHAANRRHYSLNLDFADLFKPIIVDRVIFTLVNKGIINDGCFVTNSDQSVYLSEQGKKVFIEHFQDKMYSKIKFGEKSYTYNQLIEKEIWKYQSYIRDGEKYQPYKYY